MNRVITLTKRNFKEILRDPISLVFIFGLPLVMEILFYLLFGSLTSQFEMKYLAPGIVVFSQAFLTLFMGLLISLDRSTSFITRLYVTKTKSYEFIISYALALIPLILLQSVLFFIVGGIFDSSIFKVEMIYAILLSLLTSLLFLGFGILFGSLCNERSVGGVSSIIISAQSILSGMWFPVEGLDNKFLMIMDILPFKNVTVLVQNGLNGFNDIYDDFLRYLIIVIIYIIVIFSLAIFIFKKKMKEK